MALFLIDKSADKTRNIVPTKKPTKARLVTWPHYPVDKGF